MFARLFAITSTLVCCASIPVAAMLRARMCQLLLALAGRCRVSRSPASTILHWLWSFRSSPDRRASLRSCGRSRSPARRWISRSRPDARCTSEPACVAAWPSASKRLMPDLLQRAFVGEGDDAHLAEKLHRAPTWLRMLIVPSGPTWMSLSCCWTRDRAAVALNDIAVVGDHAALIVELEMSVARVALAFRRIDDEIAGAGEREIQRRRWSARSGRSSRSRTTPRSSTKATSTVPPPSASVAGTFTRYCSNCNAFRA